MLNQPLGLGQLANFENLDLTTVDTNYPILESGIYPWRINKASTELTKDKSAEMLVLEIVTTIPTRDKNGKEVAAGYKLTHRIGLSLTFKKDGNGQIDYEKPVRTAEMIMRDVASLLDAVYGEAGRRAIDIRTFDIANLVNQTFMGRTTISPEENGFPEQTRLSRFIRKEGEVPETPAQQAA